MDIIRGDTVTILNGASLSDAATVPAGSVLVGIAPASTWDTQAVSFQVCYDGTNYKNLYNEAVEYSIAGVVASAYYRVNAAMFYGARTIKVRSGTAGAAVNQTSDTTVELVYMIQS